MTTEEKIPGQRVTKNNMKELGLKVEDARN